MSPFLPPTSVRGRFEFNSQILALSGLEEYYKCTRVLKAAVEIMQYPLQISIAMSWTLANCHVYALLYSYDVDPGPERFNTNSLPPMHRPQCEAGNHPSGPPSDILT